VILLSADQSRELDRLSRDVYGIDSYSLMTRAGEAVAESLVRRFPESLSAGVLVVAGRGNNGGDGFVAARRLLEMGVAAHALLLGKPSELKGDAARAHQDYHAAGGRGRPILSSSDLAGAFAAPPGAVIDAIFGTGLNADVAGVARAAIESINALHRPVVAVDIASGVNSDTGAVMGIAVRASLTVTFGYAKFGHASYPGAEHCGALEIADIGFAARALDDIAPRGRLLEPDDVRSLIRARPLNSHKGMFGHPLVIAGGRGKAGAALLTSRGALRMGAGLVTAAIPDCVAPIVAAGQAELMTEPVPDRDGHFDALRAPDALRALIDGKDALVVGPGIGMSDDAKQLVAWLLDECAGADRPMLLDADALNALAALGCERARRARGALVLTPHPGEASRLLRTGTAAINADRISAARSLAQRTGACTLLKGARSVIAAPDGTVYVNSSGNPGMATPGMGDALSGIVGALLAQKHAPLDALALGVFLHGYAADRVCARIGPLGYLAGDVIDELPSALAALAG
jgi:NAD(P)H-hydrate epimerase